MYVRLFNETLSMYMFELMIGDCSQSKYNGTWCLSKGLKRKLENSNAHTDMRAHTHTNKKIAPAYDEFRRPEVKGFSPNAAGCGHNELACLHVYTSCWRCARG